jgi:hypothetical protein
LRGHHNHEDIEAADALEPHKESILDLLRNAYERGPKSKPFDEKSLWDSLTDLAEWYSYEKIAQEDAIPAADRVKRLRKIAKALRETRGMLEQAKQDDVGSHLFPEWVKGIDEHTYVGEWGIADYVKRELGTFVKRLAELEAAAVRAADTIPLVRARPKGGGSKLPSEYVFELAEVYRENTGLNPEAGDKSFIKFVREFLTAVNRGFVSNDYVVDAVKYAYRRARKKPKKVDDPFR